MRGTKPHVVGDVDVGAVRKELNHGIKGSPLHGDQQRRVASAVALIHVSSSPDEDADGVGSAAHGDEMELCPPILRK